MKSVSVSVWDIHNIYLYLSRNIMRALLTLHLDFCWLKRWTILSMLSVEKSSDLLIWPWLTFALSKIWSVRKSTTTLVIGISYLSYHFCCVRALIYFLFLTIGLNTSLKFSKAGKIYVGQYTGNGKHWSLSQYDTYVGSIRNNQSDLLSSA